MKKSKFDIKTYIPLLAVGITVIGTVIGSAFTIIGKNQVTERDISWIKDEIKDLKNKIDKNATETKSGLGKLETSINSSDKAIGDVFMEILDKLEPKKKGKD